MGSVTLAEFVASYYETQASTYKIRNIPKIIRYRNYDIKNISEYKREMVLLHYPFRNDEIDILDRNKYLQLFGEF